LEQQLVSAKEHEAEMVWASLICHLLFFDRFTFFAEESFSKQSSSSSNMQPAVLFP
jgi:hypothetical protein